MHHVKRISAEPIDLTLEEKGLKLFFEQYYYLATLWDNVSSSKPIDYCDIIIQMCKFIAYQNGIPFERVLTRCGDLRLCLGHISLCWYKNKQLHVYISKKFLQEYIEEALKSNVVVDIAGEDVFKNVDFNKLNIITSNSFNRHRQPFVGKESLIAFSLLLIANRAVENIFSQTLLNKKTGLAKGIKTFENIFDASFTFFDDGSKQLLSVKPSVPWTD